LFRESPTTTDRTEQSRSALGGLLPRAIYCLAIGQRSLRRIYASHKRKDRKPKEIAACAPAPPGKGKVECAIATRSVRSCSSALLAPWAVSTQMDKPLKSVTHGQYQGIFNCLTGGACASPVEKIAPPVFLYNLPTKNFTSRSSFYNLISLNL